MPEGLEAIKLMTIHQAKGLEFPVVILPFMDSPVYPAVTEKIWFPFSKGKLERIKWGWFNFSKELQKIKQCAKIASSIGLEVHAGHGMDYKTTKILNKIKEIKEFNIGHFIIGESVFHGFKKVIKNFKKLSNT